MDIKSNYSLYNRVTIPDNANRETTRSVHLGIRPAENEPVAERSKQSVGTKILSLQELAMLHMLFGSTKPQEMEVYGKTKMQQIHKGQLIDLIG